MVIENKSRMVISLTGIVGFFLALAPILDPYVFLTIGSGITLKINDILMLLVLGILLFAQSCGLKRKTGYLCSLLCALAVISVVANIVNDTSIGNSLKNLIVWFVYAVSLLFIWKMPCRESFFRWVGVFAMIASIVVILQFVAGYLQLPMWDGKIPFLELGKYDTWSGYIDKNTRDIRPNGIFQEASYVGIYLAIAYVQAFKEGKLVRIMLFAAAMLATTSMVAVASCLIITVYALLSWKKINISRKTATRIFFIVLVAVAGMMFLVSTNEFAQEAFEYISDRADNIDADLAGDRMSSTKYRLLGHIDLFSLYTPLQKVIGVGVAQYASYWNVTSYSNVWVTTILNSGILGLIVLILVLLSLLRNIRPEDRIFFVVLLLVFSSDYQWFSWYFFYLLSACILMPKERKQEVSGCESEY